MSFLRIGVSILLLSACLAGEQTARYRPPATGSTAPLSLDCGRSTPQCPQVEIEGSEPARLSNGQPSPFRGYADPSVRKDPTSERLWMAFSWPNLHTASEGGGAAQGRGGLLGRRGRFGGGRAAGRGAGGYVPGIDIRLAYSDNGGRTWRYQGPLWPSEPDTDRGGDGDEGYTEHEAGNLLPRQVGGRVTWYGARLDYFIAAGGGGTPNQRRRPTSFRISIGEASSPEGLRNATLQVLGGGATAKGWNPDVYLTTLSPELRDCGMWNEPALYTQNDTLYLGLRCLRFNGKAPNIPRSDIVVFATDARGDAKGWKWRYVGTLARGSDARELGAPGLTQIDFAKSVDGRLLLITTPDNWDSGLQDFVHYGCKAVEIESIDPPRLARDSAGKLKVRASVTASDTMPHGPGACTYDPNLTTGILMAKRYKERGSFTSWLHSTGLKP